MRQIQLAIKRLLDVVVAALVILIFSPLLILIAIGIKIASPGPALFRQRRLGRNGEIYEIFKFRTMHYKAKPLVNADGSSYTGADDPRIYPLGRVLRKFSLDEFPQFFNVVLGHMSIVGPRPDEEKHREMYAPGEERKLEMRPGITGWAMVNGRNSIPWKRRIELDIWYIDHYNLWLDFKTAALTIPVLLFGYGVNQATAETKGDSK